MSIDWFTVAAQIINFLILVWLLKRFLYRPILDAIDAREQHIAKTLADAAGKQSQAQQEHEWFLHKNKDFELQRHALLEKATTAAAAESQRLLDEARQAAQALSKQQQASLLLQQQSLSVQLRQKTQQEVFAIARQTLSYLADADLEEQMLKVFLTQLAELDKKSKETLFGTISTSSKALRVRTTFALSAAQQKRISRALYESFATDMQINFETTPEVISGIELTVNGQKLAWSIAQYIDSLEKHIQQLLQQQMPQDSAKKTINEDSLSAQSVSVEPELSAITTSHCNE